MAGECIANALRSGDIWELNFIGFVAAYKLDRMIGLNMVPVTGAGSFGLLRSVWGLPGLGRLLLVWPGSCCVVEPGAVAQK